MAIALFITEDYVKDNSIIDGNVDAKIIETVIIESQREHILEILGTGLYDEISTQINAGTLTAINTTLLDDYISYALLYWTLYEGVDVFVYKFRNKAVLKQTGENISDISLDEHKRLMDRFKNKAEYYSERVTKYLIQNSASFPLYTNPGSGTDTIHPNGTNYSTGWYLGDGSPSCEDKLKS